VKEWGGLRECGGLFFQRIDSRAFGVCFFLLGKVVLRFLNSLCGLIQ
jgi:hypothetical protein